jgi:putative membrane protein
MALALLALAGCQIAGEAPTATTQTGANGEDVDFVTNAYQLIMFDREEGALATSEAMDPQVRALAAKMVTDANQLAAKLGPLAAAEGIRPPDILRYSLRIRLGHMRIQNGLDFDRTFVDDQVASHQEAISMHEMMAGSAGSPALRQLAQEAGPIVRGNLRQLQALQLAMMRR